MKKNIFLIAIIAIATVFSSCEDKTSKGDPEDVMSKSKYSKAIQTYYNLRDFNEGLCVVSVEGEESYTYGVINSKGKEIVPCIYEMLAPCTEGMIAFIEKEKMGFLNRKGEVVVPATYDEVDLFSEGMAAVAFFKEKDNGKHYSWDPKLYGFINKKGEVVVPLVYDHVGSFSSGLAPVQKDEKFGFINKTGEYEIPATYSAAASFSEDLAFVAKGRKEFCIDTKGEVVFTVSEKLSVCGPFKDGLAKVENDDDMYGFIDKTGKVVIPCIFYRADDFEDGVASVKKDEDGSYYEINTKGEKIEED